MPPGEECQPAGPRPLGKAHSQGVGASGREGVSKLWICYPVGVAERNNTTHVRASNEDYTSAALCQGAAGLRDQLALFQVYHNF